MFGQFFFEFWKIIPISGNLNQKMFWKIGKAETVTGHIRPLASRSGLIQRPKWPGRPNRVQSDTSVRRAVTDSGRRAPVARERWSEYEGDVGITSGKTFRPGSHP
jgi:hypothetical protein